MVVACGFFGIRLTACWYSPDGSWYVSLSASEKFSNRWKEKRLLQDILRKNKHELQVLPGETRSTLRLAALLRARVGREGGVRWDCKFCQVIEGRFLVGAPIETKNARIRSIRDFESAQ